MAEGQKSTQNHFLKTISKYATSPSMKPFQQTKLLKMLAFSAKHYDPVPTFDMDYSHQNECCKKRKSKNYIKKKSQKHVQIC